MDKLSHNELQSIEELLPLTWCEHNILEKNKIYDLFKKKGVLDIGCVTGFFTHKIARNANKVIGIDICENNINFANSRNRNSKIKFLVMDANNMNFSNNSFDVVFCSEIIEHIRNKKALLNRITQMLKSDGYLILALTTKPKHTAFMYKAHKYFDKAYDKDSPEVHKGGMFAPLYTINRVLSKSGFKKVASIKYRSPLLFSIEIMITFIERMKRGKKKFEGFADHSDWLKSPLIKFYITFLLPLIKFFVRIDSLFNFIDTTNTLIVYKRVE